MNTDWKPSHKGTFGGSKAAEVLDKILMERNDSKLFHTVGTCITQYMKIIKALKDIQDLGIRHGMIDLYRQSFIPKVKAMNLELVIETHLLNHLSTIAKQAGTTHGQQYINVNGNVQRFPRVYGGKTKNDLRWALKQLKDLEELDRSDPEASHCRADKILLNLINDDQITEAYNKLTTWCA